MPTQCLPRLLPNYQLLCHHISDDESWSVQPSGVINGALWCPSWKGLGRVQRLLGKSRVYWPGGHAEVAASHFAGPRVNTASAGPGSAYLPCTWDCSGEAEDSVFVWRFLEFSIWNFALWPLTFCLCHCCIWEEDVFCGCETHRWVCTSLKVNAVFSSCWWRWRQ